MKVTYAYFIERYFIEHLHYYFSTSIKVKYDIFFIFFKVSIKFFGDMICGKYVEIDRN